MNKKAIIIGSGFGGIASAIRLKAMNYDVTLIEKNHEKSKSPRYLPDSQTYLAYIKKPFETEYSSIFNSQVIRTMLKSP